MEVIEVDAPPEVQQMIKDSIKGQQNVETECIESSAALFQPATDEAGQCTNNLKYISSNKAEFESVCSSPDGDSKTVGEVVFSGKTVTLLAESTTSTGGMNMKMKSSSVGKYIGSCN